MDRRKLLSGTAMLFGAAIIPPIATADDTEIAAVSYPQSLINALVEAKKACVTMHMFAITRQDLLGVTRSTASTITLLDATLDLVLHASGYAMAIAQTTANSCRETISQCSRYAATIWYARVCMDKCGAAEFELRRI